MGGVEGLQLATREAQLIKWFCPSAAGRRWGGLVLHRREWEDGLRLPLGWPLETQHQSQGRPSRQRGPA